MTEFSNALIIGLRAIHIGIVIYMREKVVFEQTCIRIVCYYPDDSIGVNQSALRWAIHQVTFNLNRYLEIRKAVICLCPVLSKNRATSTPAPGSSAQIA